MNVRIGWGGHSGWQTTARPHAADVECSICAAVADSSAACPTAQAAGSCACVRACRAHKIGREGAAAVASRLARLVGLVGLVDVLWRGSRQSPSR
jgi:hypothetical protein